MPGAIFFVEIARELPFYVTFRKGDFWTSIRETMATPETSHIAAIDPLAPQPGRPTPSLRLRQCRVQFFFVEIARELPFYYVTFRKGDFWKWCHKWKGGGHNDVQYSGGGGGGGGIPTRRATRAAGVVGGGMRRGAAGICPPKHFGCAGECDQGLFSVSRKTVQFADTFDSLMHIHVNGPAQLDSSTRQGDYETTRRRGNETTRQRDPT